MSCVFKRGVGRLRRRRGRRARGRRPRGARRGPRACTETRRGKKTLATRHGTDDEGGGDGGTAEAARPAQAQRPGHRLVRGTVEPRNGDSGRSGRSSRTPPGAAPSPAELAAAAATAAAAVLVAPIGAPHASHALRGTQSMPPARRMSVGGGAGGLVVEAGKPTAAPPSLQARAGTGGPMPPASKHPAAGQHRPPLKAHPSRRPGALAARRSLTGCHTGSPPGAGSWWGVGGRG
jgi:hypothetical protein